MEDLQREELLRIEHLSVTFTQYDGWFSRKTLPVIRDLSLRVSRGEMVAVVGSSGSGKVFWLMQSWVSFLIMEAAGEIFIIKESS